MVRRENIFAPHGEVLLVLRSGRSRPAFAFRSHASMPAEHERLERQHQRLHA